MRDITSGNKYCEAKESIIFCILRTSNQSHSIFNFLPVLFQFLVTFSTISPLLSLVYHSCLPFASLPFPAKSFSFEFPIHFFSADLPCSTKTLLGMNQLDEQTNEFAIPRNGKIFLIKKLKIMKILSKD